jgi:putative ABC transport system permease protein
MNLFTLLMALRALVRNPMRSLLTSLGIVIGVAAVISMVTLGQATTDKVTNDIRSLGSNMLMVMPGSARKGPQSAGVSAPSFTTDDVKAIREQVPAIDKVAPSASRSALIVYGNRNWSTMVTGVTSEYIEVKSLSIKRGRAFTSSEIAGASACIVGATVRKELFGHQDPIGASIRLGKTGCTVVGELASKGQSSMGSDQDDLILMPLVPFQRHVQGSTDVALITVSVQQGRSISGAKSQIEGLLRERRRITAGVEDNFAVQDMREIANTLTSVLSALTALLGAIAAVSLLVGGIGIMNIMLVAVTERTREIGTRLAIGARGFDVLVQFLVEAVILSTLGGLIGIALGLGISRVACSVFSLPFTLQISVVVAAFVFSATVGVVFGFLPARRAAALRPIEALRHE